MSRLHWIALFGLAACNTNEPQYVDCVMGQPDLCLLEGGVDDGMGGTTAGSGSLHVPLKTPTVDDTNLQMQIQATIDPAVMAPVFRVDEYDLSVEWTVTNLDMADGQFRIDLNGANEMFTYDPSMIVLDPTDNEAPPTPPLTGDIPTDIPAGGTMSGVFREDELLEAAIDLDQISRGNVNPFAATLTVSKNADQFQPVTVYDPVTMTGGTPTGPAVPRSAFRAMVRVDLVFKPDHHMQMTYTLRVRPHRDVIHAMGLSAPGGELMLYDPAPYIP